MHRFKELKVWIKSMDLVEDIYKLMADLPKEEKYGLISQITRCAVSIPSNIAEGAGRNSDKELINFLHIAAGSAFELETQLIIAKRLEYINEEKLNILITQLTEIQNMIFAFQRKLKEQYTN